MNSYKSTILIIVIIFWLPNISSANETDICKARGIDSDTCISSLEKELLVKHPKKLERNGNTLILKAKNDQKIELKNKPGGELNLHHSVIVYFNRANVSLIRIDKYNEEYEYHIFNHFNGQYIPIYGWPYFSEDTTLMAVANFDDAGFSYNTIGLFTKQVQDYYNLNILLHPKYGASEVRFISDKKIEYTVYYHGEKEIEKIKYYIFFDDSKHIWKIE